MILFLNFIPIEFMGGTEQWMNNTAKKIDKYEDSQIMSINSQIANLYGMLVAKRKYDRRVKTKIHNHISLEIQSFIPLTKKWKDARRIFLKSRLIYTRYEVLEFLIVVYFSGISGLKKTIAGIHSPFIYSDPISFFDKLHNWLYNSPLYKNIFKQIKKVHVLNTKDAKYFSEVFKLQNVVYVPNGADIPQILREKIAIDKNQLNVLFVGELSTRKGVDILINIIKKSSKNIKFTIAGDGPLRNNLEEMVNENVEYAGYADKIKLDKLYRENDILILPSRAESMSLALLEAMSHGLVIVDSNNTALGLDKKVEYSCSNKNIKTYLDILEKLFNVKVAQKLSKTYIRTYFNKNFSFPIIDLKLSQKIFEVNNT